MNNNHTDISITDMNDILIAFNRPYTLSSSLKVGKYSGNLVYFLA